MPSGTGALGFGGGFGQGLASVLLQHREQQRDDENRAETRRIQGHMAALPIYLQHAQETGDYSVVEEVLGQISPDVVKQFKKQGSPFQMLGPLFERAKSMEDQPRGGTPGTGADLGLTGALGAMPAHTTTTFPTQVAEPPKMFLGRPVPTHEQKATRVAETLVAQRRVLADMASRLAREKPDVYPTVRDALIALDVPVDKESFGSLQPGSAGHYVFEKMREAQKARQPVTSAQIAQWRTEAAQQTDTSQAGETEFGQYYTDWLRDKGKKEGTATDRLTARKEFLGAGLRTEMTPGQRASFTRQLRNDMIRETSASTDAIRQVKNMQLALADVQAGRRVAGDQTIISQFNRIIEPDSVTMVSEYARSPQGVAMVDRLTEMFNRIRVGGSGVPVEQLAEFVSLAEQFAENQVARANDVSAEVKAIAEEYGIKPDLVTREFVAPTRKNQGSPMPIKEETPPGPAGAVMKDGELYINGVLIPKRK